MSSDLVVNPPDYCNEFFALYDRTLTSLLDKHAPLRGGHGPDFPDIPDFL